MTVNVGCTPAVELALVGSAEVPAEHIAALKAQTRAAAQTADNREAYEQFIAGTGMPEDAYWASMFETRKLMLTLENYTQAQKAAFLAAGHAPDETDAWHDFCYTLTKAAVDAQNITLAAPDSWTLTRENYNDTGTWPELTQSTGTPG